MSCILNWIVQEFWKVSCGNSVSLVPKIKTTRFQVLIVGNLFCIKLLSRVTHISQICWGLMPDSLQPQCVRYNGSTVQREDKQMLPTILRGGTGDCSAWRRWRSAAAAEAKPNQLSAEARNIEKTNEHSKIPLSQWVQMQASYPSMNSVLPVSSWCFLADFVNVTNIYQSNCKKLFKPSRCQLLLKVSFTPQLMLWSYSAHLFQMAFCLWKDELVWTPYVWVTNYLDKNVKFWSTWLNLFRIFLLPNSRIWGVGWRIIQKN